MTPFFLFKTTVNFETNSKLKIKMVKLATYLVLTIFSVVYFVPFWWLVSTSLKTPPQIISSSIQWLPSPIAWGNYSEMISITPFFQFLKNTIIIVIFNLGGALFVNSLVAYSFARLRWPGRDIIFLITLGSMMMPFVVSMIPLYVLFRHLGWINTFKPLIIPVWCGDAFLIFLLRQFFLTIPLELSDAARIDGASEFSIFWRIIFPLTKPALAVVAIFRVTYDWNDFLGPLIYLSSQDKYTLAIGLQLFSGAHSTQWNLQMAYATLMTIPMIILFFFLARYFTQGLTITGLKT